MTRRARSELGEQLAAALGRPALDDAAEVEAHVGAEPNRPGDTVDLDVTARRRRHEHRPIELRRHLGERAVVARADEGVVHGRIEATACPLTRGKRKLDHLEQVVAAAQAPGGVEPRELRVRTEPGEDLLESPELRLDGGERLACLMISATRDSILDRHRREHAALERRDHGCELPDLVTGGSVTTRTCGGSVTTRVAGPAA